jgi:hypothetical protein
MSDCKFECPLCGQSLEAPEDMLGEIIDCPSCNGQIQIPVPKPPPRRRVIVHPNKQTIPNASIRAEIPKGKSSRKRRGLVLLVLFSIIALAFATFTLYKQWAEAPIGSSNRTNKPVTARLQNTTRSEPVTTPKPAGNEPYAFRVMEKEDVSYGSTKRMVYRIYLNTETTPDLARMQSTAQGIWYEGNTGWNELTVFMIFGRIQDFSAGAYGIAEFNTTGLISFRTNQMPLQMLDLN